MKDQNAVYRLQIYPLAPEILKFEKGAKYSNEITDDVILSTQYYKYINRAILANLRRRALKLGRLRADLHGTSLTHATSLRQAYGMTWDHLHAYDIFTYKIKYAKVCTGIYGAKKF